MSAVDVFTTNFYGTIGHITDALISLHLLRVPERIIFKVATLTYRAMHGSAPPYLASSFTWVADMPHRRRLRSRPLNRLTFRPVVGQLSEVVPFLLLEQRCGMACQATLRRPRGAARPCRSAAVVTHCASHLQTSEFVDELSDVIASLNANSTDNLVVCGDVNCPGPTPSSVNVGLAEMLDSLGLTQLVGSPTRDNNLLDVFGVNLVDADHKRRRRRRASHLRSPHRHRQRHRLQQEADSRLHVETTPESRPIDARVHDP